MRPALARPAVVALVLAAGGCADRGLASAPQERPSTATWLVVALAVMLAGAVLARLLLGPRSRPPGLASAVLAAEAGILVVGLGVLFGVILRSWHYAVQREDQTFVAGHTLVRIGGLDGDPEFFVMMLLFTGLVGVLGVTLLVTAARFANSDHRAERWAAVAVLGIELIGAVLSVVLLARGSRWWPVIIGALQLPFLLAAIASCVPRRRPGAVPAADTGYNGSHG